MFSGKNNTTSDLSALFAEVKQYINLQKSYIGLELITNLTIMLSTLLVAILLLVLGMIVLLGLTFTLGTWLSSFLGLTIAGAIITGIYFTLAVLVYVMREKWIMRPIANFLSSLLHK